MNDSNVVWHSQKVSKEERRHMYQHKSFCLWLTGLSGAGKSTIANELDRYFFERKYKSYVLDGDNLRHGINKDLGFSAADRKENIRRVGEISKLFVDAGTIIINAIISPFHEDRLAVRNLFDKNDFIEIFIKCPIEVCESRDTKGLYKKAREGIIRNFTGISSPYEEPANPELVIDTSLLTLSESVDRIIAYLRQNEYID